jgi:hypothetical protein
MPSVAHVPGDGELIQLGSRGERAQIFYDTSGNTVVVAAPSGGTLSLDIATTAEFTIAAGAIVASAANSGAVSTFTFTNTSDDSGGGAEIGVVAGGSSASGDAKFSALQSGGHEVTFGIDCSSSLAAITMGATLGAGDTDAVRITDATPPVLTYNATHPTGTFDYVCETCHWHGANISQHSACAGIPEWHDDVAALIPVLAGATGMRLTGDEPGVRHLASLGVLEVSDCDWEGYENDLSKRWVGLDPVASTFYTWSGMVQMKNEIDSLKAQVASLVVAT